MAKKESKYGKRIFRIEVTAIYNEDMEAEKIADELSDGLFNILKKNGRRLAVLNVDSVKVPQKPDETAMRIISELSNQRHESMSMQETDDGGKYVVVSKEEPKKDNGKITLEELMQIAENRKRKEASESKPSRKGGRKGKVVKDEKGA